MLPSMMSRETSWAMPTLRREFDDLFERFFGDFTKDGSGRTVSGWQAPVAIWDDDQNVFIEVELPGVAREEVELSIQGECLHLRGERKAPVEKRDYWYNERIFGRFERTISLSEMVDPEKIEAEMHDGVLSIKLVKRTDSQRRRIEIKTAKTDMLRDE